MQLNHRNKIYPIFVYFDCLLFTANHSTASLNRGLSLATKTNFGHFFVRRLFKQNKSEMKNIDPKFGL